VTGFASPIDYRNIEMPEIEALIESLEVERCQALVAADMETLDRLFSERLNWCHSSGKVDSKAQLLAKISSGATKYLTMERTDTRVIAGRNGGVATGLVNMAAIVAGTEHQLSNRYATTWLEEADGWKLVAWQSTKAPVE
jgi:hypothetical protein